MYPRLKFPVRFVSNRMELDYFTLNNIALLRTVFRQKEEILIKNDYYKPLPQAATLHL